MAVAQLANRYCAQAVIYCVALVSICAVCARVLRVMAYRPLARVGGGAVVDYPRYADRPVSPVAVDSRHSNALVWPLGRKRRQLAFHPAGGLVRAGRALMSGALGAGDVI